MRRSLFAAALAASFAVGACQPTSPDAPSAEMTASDPSSPAPPGSGTVAEPDAPGEGSAIPAVPVIGPGERTGPPGAVDIVGAESPTDVAAPLLLAAETHDPELAEQALRTLSRNLAVWRRRPDPDLVEAVRMFAASSSAPLWRTVDARFVPPAIELLLEIRDMAAVARLTSAFAESAAEPALRGPRALVARDTTPRASIEAEPGCTLHIDGAPEDGAAEVLVGSHQVGCAPDARRLVVLFANERIAVGPSGVRVIEADATE